MIHCFRKIILPLLFFAILVGCTSPSKSALDMYSSLDENLSEEDQILLESLKSHVEKFVRLNNELDMLLEEMKNNDELEAAIETMEIANEEAMYIYNLIELDDDPTNTSLRQLKNYVQKAIEEYMKEMNTQLEGISTGDTMKTDNGFEGTQNIYEELNTLLSTMEGP